MSGREILDVATSVAPMVYDALYYHLKKSEANNRTLFKTTTDEVTAPELPYVIRARKLDEIIVQLQAVCLNAFGGTTFGGSRVDSVKTFLFVDGLHRDENLTRTLARKNRSNKPAFLYIIRDASNNKKGVIEISRQIAKCRRVNKVMVIARVPYLVDTAVKSRAEVELEYELHHRLESELNSYRNKVALPSRQAELEKVSWFGPADERLAREEAEEAKEQARIDRLQREQDTRRGVELAAQFAATCTWHSETDYQCAGLLCTNRVEEGGTVCDDCHSGY